MRGSLLVATLALAACEDAPAKHSDAGVDGGGDLSITSSAQFTWSGTITADDVTDAGDVPDGGLMPLDATICVIETGACQDEAGGEFSLMVSEPVTGATASYGATIKSPGYLGQTVLIGLTSGTDTTGTFVSAVADSGVSLKSDAQASAYFAKGGISYPETTTGYVSVTLRVAGNGHAFVSGGTATISNGATNTVYADSNRELDPTLTSTSSSGEIVFGGVTPGPFVVTVNVPGQTCTPLYNFEFPGSGTNAIGGELAAATMKEDLQFNCQ